MAWAVNHFDPIALNAAASHTSSRYLFRVQTALLLSLTHIPPSPPSFNKSVCSLSLPQRAAIIQDRHSVCCSSYTQHASMSSPVQSPPTSPDPLRPQSSHPLTLQLGQTMQHDGHDDHGNSVDFEGEAEHVSLLHEHHAQPSPRRCSNNGDRANTDSATSSAIHCSSFVFGLLLILCVVLLWVASSVLAQTLFADSEFDHPFALTYLATSAFTLYLPISLMHAKCAASEQQAYDGHGGKREFASLC